MSTVRPPADGDLTTTAIGAVLSGGGSRATGFHLGTFEYLDRVGLLDHLTMISTASGGSFIGAKYALCLANGMDFDAFFEEFYLNLRDTEALRGLLERLCELPLGEDGYAVGSRRRNLIICAADTYAHTFLCSKDGKPYLFGNLLAQPKDFRLEEVLFNTTEYRTGIAFRFARGFKLGNANIPVPPELELQVEGESGQIRMADIVAASSCLPSVFEPIAFPDDFAWPGGVVPPGIRRAFPPVPGPIPLMDGGIYDNQAIESLMLADLDITRNELSQRVLLDVLGEGVMSVTRGAGSDGPKPPRSRLGVFIVSDADRVDGDIFPYSKERLRLNRADDGEGVKLETISRLAWVLMVVCLVVATTAGGHLIELFVRGSTSTLWDTGWDMLLYVVSLLLAGSTGFGLWWARRSARGFLKGVPQSRSTTWRDIRGIRVSSVQGSFRLVMAGLVSTVNSVMPKRMRELGYWILYTDPRYKGKRLSNLIYHLQSAPGTGARARENLAQFGAAPPSDALQATIDDAATMETRFWYREPGELQGVVICGQATICYNLMKFIARYHGTDAAAFPPEVRDLWRRLHADWEALRADPCALLRERFDRVGIADLQ